MFYSRLESETRMVDVWLPYGKTEICARIPTRNFLGSLEPRDKLGVSDPIAEVRRALYEPIGSPKLNEIVSAGTTVAIVVDDVTRSAPTKLMLPPLLEELKATGVKDDDVTIIFGCGTHRAVTHEEAVELLGETIVNRYRVVSHDCQAQDNVFVGKTKKHGTKVYLNRFFAEADVKILTGDVGLHYYAGFGGGRKSVLPGVSGLETIRHNHAMLLHPKARTGNLDGNPVHEDMIEAAKLAKVDFILNVVQNKKGEIVRAFAGDLEKAFYEGVRLVEEMYKIPIERKADIVIVSPGGAPADITLFQAYKAVDNALEAIKRGGIIILAAECPEGHGNKIFYEWMVKFKRLKDVERQIKRNFVLGGHKAYYLLKALQKVKIILVSCMPDYYVQNVFHLDTARAINDAVDEAFRIAGAKAKVWAMPLGNFTLPVVKAEA